MYEYFTALIIFALFLIICGVFSALVTKFIVKNKINNIKANNNWFTIVNYVYDICAKVDANRIEDDCFLDIKMLFNEIINNDLSMSVIDSIVVEKREPKSTNSNNIIDITDNYRDLLSMKRLLIVMIMSHKLNIFNADDLIENPEKEMLRLSKVVARKSKWYQLFVKIIKTFIDNNESEYVTYNCLQDNVNNSEFNNKEHLAIA